MLLEAHMGSDLKGKKAFYVESGHNGSKLPSCGVTAVFTFTLRSHFTWITILKCSGEFKKWKLEHSQHFCRLLVAILLSAPLVKCPEDGPMRKVCEHSRKCSRAFTTSKRTSRSLLLWIHSDTCYCTHERSSRSLIFHSQCVGMKTLFSCML